MMELSKEAGSDDVSPVGTNFTCVFFVSFCQNLKPQSGECMATILEVIQKNLRTLKERPVSAGSKAFGMLGIEKTMVSGGCLILLGWDYGDS